MPASFTQTSPYVGLEFSFSDVLQEINSLEVIAKGYIWKDSVDVLKNFGENLNNLRCYETSSYSWTISEAIPLCTVPSEGKYDKKHGEPVFGQISCIWEIKPKRELGWKKTKLSENFVLYGNASTKVKIFRGTPDRPGEEMAMWRMEIGVRDSPGCHFHVQILGAEDDPPFPKSLPIPRLPAMFVTPMSVFEYLLGELFQKDWAQEVSRESDSTKFWSSIQKKRLSVLLTEQHKEVSNCKSSPWSELKRWKPQSDLFLS